MKRLHCDNDDGHELPNELLTRVVIRRMFDASTDVDDSINTILALSLVSKRVHNFAAGCHESIFWPIMTQSNTLLMLCDPDYVDLTLNPIITDCTLQTLVLKSAKLRSNTMITDQGLLPHADTLKFLDISKNTLITNNCLSMLTTLKTLVMSDNAQITNISTLTNLISLDVSNDCMFTEIDLPVENLILQFNTRVVSMPDTITRLDLTGNDLITGELLLRLPFLSNLVLDVNEEVTDDYLSQLTNLQDLSLMFNNVITDNGITGLNLTHLRLGYNTQITDLGLRSLTQLECLYLGDNSVITNHGVSVLTDLKSIMLSNNNIITSAAFVNIYNLIGASLEGCLVSIDDIKLNPFIVY